MPSTSTTECQNGSGTDDGDLNVLLRFKEAYRRILNVSVNIYATKIVVIDQAGTGRAVWKNRYKLFRF